MNFLNRLKYYLIGVGLGILMVMAIFKDRKLTSWTPQNQILKEMTEKPIDVSEKTLCFFECGGISGENEIDSILSIADVDFKLSNVEDHDAREYLLKIEDHSIDEIRIVIFPDTIEIVSINLPGTDCDCQ